MTTDYCERSAYIRADAGRVAALPESDGLGGG